MTATIIEKGAKLIAPYINLYTAPTPNGYKIIILLELLGLDYNIQLINIMKNVQKEDWYLKMNPNGRIPTLLDVNKDGEETVISESGAILMYLADKYDKSRKFSYEIGTKNYYLDLEWLMFQMAGVGPMKGQCHHFALFAKEKIPYAIERYTNETRRLYGVLEERLIRNGTGFLVGDHIGLADIATYPWVAGTYIDLGLKDFKHLTAWVDKIGAIPEVAKSMTVITRDQLK
ncbi:hypothetical protein BVG19_g262 [[Candida] boidinii]|nr:hypothetical protein BVG19_g262 [[Candida] boidinii]OWB49753.1 transferase activity protein [[Candida] boidinii]